MTTGQFHVSSKQVRLGAGLDKRTSHNDGALRSIVPQTYFQTSRGGVDHRGGATAGWSLDQWVRPTLILNTYSNLPSVCNWQL